eukprot:CAMPEP_0206374418 /NCGR_PEP_ID=MMETSP0294-20121207/8296_1 /ASSEMBLY_ACC=CAM_ASM_000327 /TAXON_ID=39354 /ORGANISM="Heterosigma akashiwo, Strain CCMP2393" /LENGTH=176 /DNA_ID=CAMNT_0053822191 /DNA_START=530 /DNA_END=1058 /DNA_ORIENTATION=+
MEQHSQNDKISCPVSAIFVAWAVTTVSVTCVIDKLTHGVWGHEDDLLALAHSVALVMVACAAVYAAVLPVRRPIPQQVIPPEFTCGLLSYLTFSWLSPMIRLGTMKQLDFEDLPPLASGDGARVSYEKFKKNCAKISKEENIKTMKVPSVEERGPSDPSGDMKENGPSGGGGGGAA